MKKGALLLILVFLFSIPLFCQDPFFDNYVYQSWNSFGTLNGTTITDIVQTSDGYINIGTYEGLARFDGVAFTTHKRSADNDLSFVSVRAILEDSRGRLWLGSNDEGVQCISGEGKKTYNTQSGLPNNSIRCFVEDNNGNVWIGTAAGVVYVTPEGHLFTPQFEAGTVSKGTIAISFCCDKYGNIWLITANENGLFLFRDGLFRARREFAAFTGGTFFATSICQDKEGKFWIGLGDHGLVRLTENGVEQIVSGTIADTSPTTASYVAPDGTIWFGTERGLVVYSEGQFHEYTASGLNSAKINKIMGDRENHIWIATDRNGIGKLTRGKFKIIRMEDAVNSIAEDRAGLVWIGTDNGVLCYDHDKPVTNTLTEYTAGLRIRDVCATKNGDLLVSCYTKPGQLRYDGETIQSWTTDDGLAGNKVRVAIETKPNELYVGTTTGLSIIHADGSIRNFKIRDGLENEYIMALYEDTNGVIWIGTDGGGIYLMKEEVLISHITSEKGLAGNVIFKITQELDGSFWICSGSGVTRCPNFDSRSGMPYIYQNLNSDNGIETDSMFQLLVDGSNTLWMTSNHGIAAAPLEDIIDTASGRMRSVSVKFYSRNDGLDSDGPTSTAKSLVDRYGRVWFAMVDGIAIYDPKKSFENTVMPLVQIQSVVVDNVVVLDNSLYTFDPSSIVLNPGTKRVDITYTGLSFDAPERIHFTHKLTNFEDDFSAAAAVRTMSYTNLSPGTHIFFVNAINADGFYSDSAEAVLFVQKPYIYQMPAFWVVLILVVLGGIFLLFHYKQRRILRENVRLEKMVVQRTSELHEAKEKSDYLLRAILPAPIAEELKNEIHSIGQNFDDVTILFSDIVGFTTLSSGHTPDEIVNALNDLFTLFDVRAERYGVEKIKTIGDAYMASCGLPTPNEDHAMIMMKFAKGMLEDLKEYNKTAKLPFQIRIGLNSGPATAGVIGRTKFIYDVWGNTVNVASRMESIATPGGIRVSENVYMHLKDRGIKFSEPIECDVKGKGRMITYDVL